MNGWLEELSGNKTLTPEKRIIMEKYKNINTNEVVQLIDMGSIDGNGTKGMIIQDLDGTNERAVALQEFEKDYQELKTLAVELQKTFDLEGLKEYTNKEVFDKAKESLDITIETQEDLNKALLARTDLNEHIEATIESNKAKIKELMAVEIDKLAAENKLLSNAGKAIIAKIDEETLKLVKKPVEDTIDEATQMIIPGKKIEIDKVAFHLTTASTPKGYDVKVTDEDKLYEFIKENVNERGVYKIETTNQEVQVMFLNMKGLKDFAKATNGGKLPGTEATSTVRTILKKYTPKKA